MYYVLKKKDLPKFVKLLNKNFEVIAPVKKNGSLIFDKVSSADEIVKNYINTDYPPKNFFLPDGETIFEYKKSNNIKIKHPGKPKKKVIYGIRPCDVNALLKLDKILGGEFYYRIKRENTKIIAINCTKAGENCFCTSLGDDQLKEGFDLLLTDVGKEFYIKIGSEWGKKLMKHKIFKRTENSFKKTFFECKRFFLAKDLDKKIERNFNTKIWEKHFKKCFSCTACSVVCPMCYCFDLVQVPKSENEGKVKKFWSSCLSKEFSRVAGDFIFRDKRVNRVRQFLSHKFLYGKKHYDEFLCVGCGRCISHCPVGIDYEKFLEEIK